MHFRRASRRRCDLYETDTPPAPADTERALNAADHPGLDAANHHQAG